MVDVDLGHDLRSVTEDMLPDVGADGLWKVAQPFIAVPPPRPQGGGSDESTGGRCWRAVVHRSRPAARGQPGHARPRFAGWTKSGLGERLHQRLPHRLGAVGEVDRSWAVVDSIAVRAGQGAI